MSANACPPAVALALEDLRCAYGAKVVLDVPRLTFARGKITCVLGPSGCGKSTLLRNLLLLERPTRGRILADGVDLVAADPAAVDSFRRRSGVLFQGAALFQSLTLAENTAFPLLERGGVSEALALDLARRTLAAVGLAEAADLPPSRVSGGMKKRAGIARAIVAAPDYLFLDEPSAGLDPVTAAGIDRLILEVRARSGTTVVVITHELASLHTVADDLVMLHGGTVLAAGPRATVEADPHPAVRAFFERRPPPAAAPRSAFRHRLDDSPARP
jgi:phospholipid/cholesterol/gamma-HCH transport system ATP-binding protein